MVGETHVYSTGLILTKDLTEAVLLMLALGNNYPYHASIPLR